MYSKVIQLYIYTLYTYIYVYIYLYPILFQILFPLRLLPNIEQSKRRFSMSKNCTEKAGEYQA